MTGTKRTNSKLSSYVCSSILFLDFSHLFSSHPLQRHEARVRCVDIEFMRLAHALGTFPELPPALRGEEARKPFMRGFRSAE